MANENQEANLQPNTSAKQTGRTRAKPLVQPEVAPFLIQQWSHGRYHRNSSQIDDGQSSTNDTITSLIQLIIQSLELKKNTTNPKDFTLIYTQLLAVKAILNIPDSTPNKSDVQLGQLLIACAKYNVDVTADLQQELDHQLSQLNSTQLIQYVLNHLMEEIAKDLSTQEMKALGYPLKLYTDDIQFKCILGFLFLYEATYKTDKLKHKTIECYIPFLYKIANINSKAPDSAEINSFILIHVINNYILKNLSKLSELSLETIYENTGVKRYIEFLNDIAKFIYTRNVPTNFTTLIQCFYDFLGLFQFTAKEKQKRHKAQPLPFKKHSDFATYIKKRWVTRLKSFTEIMEIASIAPLDSLASFLEKYQHNIYIFKLALQDKLEKYGFNKITEQETIDYLCNINIADYTEPPRNLDKKRANIMLHIFLGEITNNLKNNNDLIAHQQAFTAITELCSKIANVKDLKQMTIGLNKDSNFATTLHNILTRFNAHSIAPTIDNDVPCSEAYSFYVERIQKQQQNLTTNNSLEAAINARSTV